MRNRRSLTPAGGQLVFITGTDTGVGKTLLASLLLRGWREQGIDARGLKPVSSGGRQDARRIREAMGRTASLDQVNPFHFPVPLAPLVAARRCGIRLELETVLAAIEEVRQACEVLVVEGAGGLLSPLGHGFSTADLIAALKCQVICMAPNKLGVINHVMLTVHYLEHLQADLTCLVLVNPARPSLASAANPPLFRELMPGKPVFCLPHLKCISLNYRDLKNIVKKIQKMLARRKVLSRL